MLDVSHEILPIQALIQNYSGAILRQGLWVLSA